MFLKSTFYFLGPDGPWFAQKHIRAIFQGLRHFSLLVGHCRVRDVTHSGTTGSRPTSQSESTGDERFAGPTGAKGA